MQFRPAQAGHREIKEKEEGLVRRCLNAKIRTRFLEKAVPYNWVLMEVAGGLSAAVQSIGLARMLLAGTPAGGAYLGFYLSILALSACLLGGRRLLRHRSLGAQYTAQRVVCALFIAWQAAFGCYDLWRLPSLSKIGSVTVLMAFAALAMMEPLYAVVSLGLSFGVMVGFITALGYPDAGFSYAVMGGVSLAVYLVRIWNIRTELLRAQEMDHMSRALEENEEQFLLTSEQYELLLQRGRMVTFVWNIRSGAVRFSRQWKEIFGAPQRLEQAADYIRESPRLTQLQKEELFQCMDNARRMNYQKKDLLLPVKTGEQRWFEFQMATQCGPDGQPLLGVGVLFDIMDQKSRILALQKELEMDPFTKTLNKAALERYAVRRLQELEPDQHLGMLVLDMDDFKNINDTYGHLCGDAVLVQLGELMKGLAPAGTRVGRLGGDEFSALVDLPGGEEEARAYAAALIQAVPGIRWEGQALPAACSIGIAFCTRGVSYLELYAAADRALYRAKGLGKGRFCVAPLVEAGADADSCRLSRPPED